MDLIKKCVFWLSVFLLHYLTIATFIGEALLVTSGLVLYFGDFLACTIAKVTTILFSFIEYLVLWLHAHKST